LATADIVLKFLVGQKCLVGGKMSFAKMKLKGHGGQVQGQVKVQES
jgi:hypothetical protein